MINYEAIHHVSLAVTDIERAKNFYKNVLQFKEIERPNFGFPGAWFQIGSQQLHLIVHDHAQTLRTNGGINSRDGHFAVRIQDYEAALTYLTQQGIEIKSKPASKSGFKQIFCCDPDGNLIEFNVDQN
ncbi:VOC family protein [Bacillus taeanensis]|uniref:Glyoxalase n=1 Tax=Bacillus taeanensis TaxID=273032 RepID=A0A366XTV1_9BACI|nr:VOC family protein [Bacillus taeanensis]RBW68978.1 glyoxalase [Bacillus taeanensis]